MELVKDYKPPHWTKPLAFNPEYKIKLGNSPTPIQKWTIPNIPEGYEISIKRDDMTDCILTGNKCRSLEFLLADALKTGSKHVIAGGSQASNMCRSVAISARQVGLQPHLIVQSEHNEILILTPQDECGGAPEGNMLLNRLAGADIHFVENLEELEREIDHLATDIKETTGEESYKFPVGGTNAVGVFGYIDAFEEMISQNLFESFDDVVVALASSGTAVALGVANYLTGSKLKIHGVPVFVSPSIKTTVRGWADDLLNKLGLPSLCLEDIVDIMERDGERGYGISGQEEKEFVVNICRSTGIVLDTYFAGKAALGMVSALQKSPGRFKGSRILFIHTGGAFELFDGKLNATLSSLDEKN